VRLSIQDVPDRSRSIFTDPDRLGVKKIDPSIKIDFRNKSGSIGIDRIDSDRSKSIIDLDRSRIDLDRTGVRIDSDRFGSIRIEIQIDPNRSKSVQIDPNRLAY